MRGFFLSAHIELSQQEWGFTGLTPLLVYYSTDKWNLKPSSSGKKVPCPNVLSILDQESAGSPSLSGEAYARFRPSLGKIAWMSQTRQDLKHFVALLGTVQAAPTQASEKALRALLRFLSTDEDVSLRLPSEHGLGSKDFREVVA